ncbi:MAG: hypothetical protein JWO86_5104 [Myxococcaceae bacterium]|nr:hypothetical protein [Myxococcaceae bacterium]
MKCYMTEAAGAAGSQSLPTWDVIITDWALGSYLDLKHRQVFTDQEYWSVLRPDVELLRAGIPSPDPKFASSSFWGPAKQGNVTLSDGYKMKWHNVGQGRIQLRLPVMAGPRKAFLCEAYVKANAATEQRKMARLRRT